MNNRTEWMQAAAIEISALEVSGGWEDVPIADAVGTLLQANVGAMMGRTRYSKDHVQHRQRHRRKAILSQPW